MAKKEEKKDEVKVEPKKEEKKVLNPIDHEYGREDLNEMRDKLNELIKAHNNK